MYSCPAWACSPPKLLAKVGVAGSNPVVRSRKIRRSTAVSDVERSQPRGGCHWDCHWQPRFGPGTAVAPWLGGHIRQRGQESFEIKAFAGRDPLTGRDRYIYRTVKGTRKVAERELTALLSDLDDRKVIAGPKRTFEEAARKWLEMASPDMSPGTVVTTTEFLDRCLIPNIDHIPVADIETEHLDLLYARLRRKGPAGKPLAPSTIARVHGIAHRVLDQARRWKWIAINPAVDATPRRCEAPTDVP
jgi:integrase